MKSIELASNAIYNLLKSNRKEWKVYEILEALLLNPNLFYRAVKLLLDSGEVIKNNKVRYALYRFNSQEVNNE